MNRLAGEACTQAGLVNKLKLVAKYAAAAFILYFLFIYVKNTTADLDLAAIVKSALPSYLVLSFVLSVSYVLNYTLIWHHLTKLFSCQITFEEAFKARVYSEFGKYAPGKALSLASVLYFYNKASVSKTRVSICLAVEIVFTMMSSVLVFLASIPFARVEVTWEVRSLAAFLAAAFLILVYPPVFNKILRGFCLLTKADPLAIEVTSAPLFGLLALYSLNWTVAGASFFFLIKSLAPVGWDSFLMLNGINALSGFIGFIAVLTPAGIGVREGTMLLLLTRVLSQGVAGIASIVSRLWLISAELSLLAAAVIYPLLKKVLSKPDRTDTKLR